MTNPKLSVVLATRNEAENIAKCLSSVKNIASEIIIFDEESIDMTCEIAKKFGAKVFKVKHQTNFHITKQKAIDAATGDWVLQLDADERVSPGLAKEIVEVINSDNNKLLKNVITPSSGRLKFTFRKQSLFSRHQHLIEEREGHLGKSTGEVVAFFVPRRNYFLGAPLIHAGVYPDGVIRLIKRGKAHLPAKSVHELMEVDGEVGWLFNDLEHHESPTLTRYLARMNRYTDLHARELKDKKVPANYLYMFLYSFLLPTLYFLRLYFRHLGFLDGMRGFIWSVFSSLHYPISYFKYWQMVKK